MQYALLLADKKSTVCCSSLTTLYIEKQEPCRKVWQARRRVKMSLDENPAAIALSNPIGKYSATHKVLPSLGKLDTVCPYPGSSRAQG